MREKAHSIFALAFLWAAIHATTTEIIMCCASLFVLDVFLKASAAAGS